MRHSTAQSRPQLVPAGGASASHANGTAHMSRLLPSAFRVRPGNTRAAFIETTAAAMPLAACAMCCRAAAQSTAQHTGACSSAGLHRHSQSARLEAVSAALHSACRPSPPQPIGASGGRECGTPQRSHVISLCLQVVHAAHANGTAHMSRLLLVLRLIFEP